MNLNEIKHLDGLLKRETNQKACFFSLVFHLLVVEISKVPNVHKKGCQIFKSKWDDKKG